MTSTCQIRRSASELLEAARQFETAAQAPDSHVAAPEALATLEQALQVLSAAWCQLAANASPGIVERRRGRSSSEIAWPRVDGLSREQEVRLMTAFHDVAAAFARCARACRDGRSTAGPIIDRRISATPAINHRAASELSCVEMRGRRTQPVA
jgi:hypothetical protein